MKSKQTGAGLIEVLVSLLILGVGLLGVLSLQSNGLNSGQRAVFVTEAQILAQDMADRIMGFGNGADGALAGNYAGISITDDDPGTYANCSGGCDAGQTVAFDVNQWQEQLFQSSLPGSLARVVWDGDSQIYTVRVSWDQDRLGATTEPGDCTAVNDTSTTLTCFELQVGLGDGA